VILPKKKLNLFKKTHKIITSPNSSLAIWRVFGLI